VNLAHATLDFIGKIICGKLCMTVILYEWQLIRRILAGAANSHACGTHNDKVAQGRREKERRRERERKRERKRKREREREKERDRKLRREGGRKRKRREREEAILFFCAIARSLLIGFVSLLLADCVIISVDAGVRPNRFLLGFMVKFLTL
jgi:hypothetical protein